MSLLLLFGGAPALTASGTLRQNIRGRWIAPAPRLTGTCDVQILSQGAWVPASAAISSELSLLLATRAEWAVPGPKTNGIGIVANPGERVIVIDASPDDDVLLIQS